MRALLNYTLTVRSHCQDCLMTFIQYKGQIKISGLLNLYVGASKKTTTVRTHATYLRKAGEAYFISDDSPVNNFEFFRPLTEGLGYTMPKLKLPITLVYMVAFLTELVHSVVGKYIYNFQPLLTRAEVYKSGVTHYLSMKKACDDLGYNPQKYALNGVTEHFKKNGHGRHKHPSHLLYYLVNIVIGIMFACLFLAWLPRVDTCQVAGSF